MFENLSREEIVMALEETARDDRGIFFDFVELNDIACELYFDLQKLINGEIDKVTAKRLLNQIRKDLALSSYSFLEMEKEELD